MHVMRRRRWRGALRSGLGRRGWGEERKGKVVGGEAVRGGGWRGSSVRDRGSGAYVSRR